MGTLSFTTNHSLTHLSPRLARAPVVAPRSPVRCLPARDVLPIEFGRAPYANLQQHRRPVAPDARRRRRARLFRGLPQFLYRSTLSRYRESLQRSVVLFGGSASAFELHAVDAHRGGWIAASCGWD